MSSTAEEQSYRERRPAAAIAGLVSCVWIQRVGPAAPPYTHRSVPNGSVELDCRIGSMPRVLGPRTGPRVQVLAPGTTVVGVRFLPGAAGSVLGMPAAELVDLAVPADELWGRSAVALGERIALCASPEEAAAVLQAQVARVAGGGDPSGPDRRRGGAGADALAIGRDRLAHDVAVHLRAPAPATLPGGDRRRAEGAAPDAAVPGVPRVDPARRVPGPGTRRGRARPARRRRRLRRPVAPDARVPAAQRALAAGVPRRDRAPMRSRARPRGLLHALLGARALLRA